MGSNYESRLERLGQEIAEPVTRALIAYLYDSDTRPVDWMEVQGQRLDRGENEDDCQQRVLESLGVADWHVTVVHYVDSDGNGGPRLPEDA